MEKEILIKEFLHNPSSEGNPYRTNMENAFIYLLPSLASHRVVKDESQSYQVLLASVYTTGFDSYREFASQHPDAFKVVGGWHPSLMPEEMLQFADAVVVGPGEAIVDEVITEGKRGIFYGQPKDQLPARENNEFRMTSVGLDLSHRMMSARTRLGCTEHCTFCCTPQVYHGNSSALSLDIFEEDIWNNRKRFTDVFLTDTDIFQHSEENIQRICQTIERAGLRGHAFISSKYFSEEKFDILERNKWFRILVGVEGQSTIHWGKANENIIKIRERCQNSGIIFTGGFIFSKETPIESFMEQCWSLMPDQMTFSFLCPFPGTVIGKKYGIRPDEYWALNGFDNAYMFTGDPGETRKKLAEFCLGYYTSPQDKRISKMVEGDLCLLSTEYYYDLTHKQKGGDLNEGRIPNSN